VDWANALPWILCGVAVFFAAGGQKYLTGLLPSGGALPESLLKSLELQAGKLGEEVAGVQKCRAAFDAVVDDLSKSAAHSHDMDTVAGRFACYDRLSGWLAANGATELAAKLDADVPQKLFKRELAAA
jgi:hypothetical protein